MTSTQQQQELQQASSTGDQVTLLKLLREADTNISGKDKAGWTALMRAAVNGHHNIVTVLLQAEFPPEINCQNKFGKTALHYACGKGHSVIVKALLFYGANPRIQDKAGKTPLDDCVESQNTRLLAEIEQNFPAIVLPPRMEPPHLEYALPNMICSGWKAPTVEFDEDLTQEEKNEIGTTEYRLQLAVKNNGPPQWKTIALCIKAVTFRVRGVDPATEYVLRVSAKNQFGWGPWSPPSEIMKTKQLLRTPSNVDSTSSIDSECSSDDDQVRNTGRLSHSSVDSQDCEESAESLPNLSAREGIMFSNTEQYRGARSVNTSGFPAQKTGTGTPPKFYANTDKSKVNSGGSSSRSPPSKLDPHNRFPNADNTTPRKPTSLPSIQRKNSTGSVPESYSQAEKEKDTTTVVIRNLQRQNGELSKEVRKLNGDPQAIDELSLEELRSLESTLEQALQRTRRRRDVKIQESMGTELERKLCVACCCQEKTVLLLPCKHLCMCDDCSSQLMEAAAEDARRSRNEDLKPHCPICRAEVSQLMSIFS
eukprot:gb/GECG01001174.1/.p1 GENE.gb/GECG01001174.1/~~gb/GECG01001174.1/.p1  ORF type:complete len:537 (+),score=85.81 gb/GECG01001174.1/:1-1611(+)